MAYVGSVKDDTKKLLGREPLLLSGHTYTPMSYWRVWVVKTVDYSHGQLTLLASSLPATRCRRSPIQLTVDRSAYLQWKRFHSRGHRPRAPDDRDQPCPWETGAQGRWSLGRSHTSRCIGHDGDFFFEHSHNASQSEVELGRLPHGKVITCSRSERHSTTSDTSMLPRIALLYGQMSWAARTVFISES